MAEAERYITIAEAATILGVSLATVRYYIRTGQLQSYRRLGRRVFLRETDVRAFGEPRPIPPSASIDDNGEDGE